MKDNAVVVGVGMVLVKIPILGMPVYFYIPVPFEVAYLNACIEKVGPVGRIRRTGVENSYRFAGYGFKTVCFQPGGLPDPVKQLFGV